MSVGTLVIRAPVQLLLMDVNVDVGAVYPRHSQNHVIVHLNWRDHSELVSGKSSLPFAISKIEFERDVAVNRDVQTATVNDARFRIPGSRRDRDRDDVSPDEV